MPEARLITIPFSHFCEKARWALDATGLPYREEPHAPVAHLLATRAVGGKSVPVLVQDGAVLRDSTDIALHADALASPGRRLVPTEGDARARVLSIEQDLDETLGIDARLLVYWHALGEDVAARAFAERVLRVRSAALRRVVGPLFRALIFRNYRVSRETAARAEARVRATFARLGEAARDGGYLVGERFTLADLTFAALAAPLLGPPEHPVMGRLAGKLPPGIAPLSAELRDTPAGRHALRVYRDHRRAAVAAPSSSQGGAPVPSPP